jgi:hypothetical protein
MTERLWRLVGALASAAAVALVASMVPFRGFNLWAVWQLESAQRFVVWRAQHTPDTLAAAFAGDVVVFPLTGYLASLATSDPAALLAPLRTLSLVAAVVVALYTWSAARRAAGPVAGVVAVAALLTTPRFVGAITSIGPTAVAMGAVCLAAAVVLRAARSARWAWLLGPALFAACASSLSGFLLLIPVFWLLFVGRGAGRAEAGKLAVRPATLGMLLAIPVALGMFAIFPYFRVDTADRLGELLSYWLTRGAEPWLYFGERYGVERIPWVAPAVVLSLTMPVIAATLMWLGVGATVASWRISHASDDVRDDVRDGQHETLRHAKVLLLWALVVPVVLRSLFHGGVDLLAFAVPFGAVLAGVGAALIIRAIAPQVRRRLAVATGVTALIVASAAFESAGAMRAPEAFYNAAIGSTRGAAAAGFSRAAHAPLPVVGAQIALSNGPRVALLTNAWEYRPVLDAYRRFGWIGDDPVYVEPAAADAIIMHHDETLPETWNVSAELASARATMEHAVVFELDGLPLVSFFRRP